MRILIYKRTHVGDPDAGRQFGNEGCMGRIRGFAFDAVIGVGGISGLPTQQGIAEKINWVGRRPKKSSNPIDSRGPLVSFSAKDFRLFEQQGPLLSKVAPLLAKRVFNSRARFFFSSLSSAEQREAQQLIKRILDLGEFDHLQLATSASILRSSRICKLPLQKGRCSKLRIEVTPNPALKRDCANKPSRSPLALR
jgi:hypothetical protein